MAENTDPAWLDQFGGFDPAYSPALDRLTEVAARLLRVPVAALSFAGDKHQVVQAAEGYDIGEVLQEMTFCRHMLAQPAPAPMVVLDAATDDRFRNHAMVTGEPHIRFYAAVPVMTAAGTAIGALSVGDTKPRALMAAEDIGTLQALAEAVSAMLQPQGSASGGQAAHGLSRGKAEVQTVRLDAQQSNQMLSDLATQLRHRTEELTEAHCLAKLGTWRMSPDRATMTWSDEVYALVGRSRGDIAPSFATLLEHVYPDDHNLLVDWIASAGHCRPERQVEARLVRADGRVRQVRIDGRLTPDGSLAGYIQDWSDRWETQQALMRSEKLAILGHLTGGVAHDFNNLLTVVTLNLEESILDLPDSDDLQMILVPALQAARKCVELTNQLLSYARQAPLRPEIVTMDTFFESARPMIRRALGKKHSLEVKVVDGGCTSMVDPTQLQTALVNLALNARDAMQPGGGMTVTVRKVQLPSRHYAIEGARPGGYILISAADSGTGIPPGVLPRIFEPFFTTKPVGSGSGLGLSMVDGFVRQSGGHILVDTSADGGTDVRLLLPLAEDSGAGTSAEPERPRALLVEDQPAVLATVSRMFKQLGYDVAAVADAPAALAELDRSPSFDVLFTDVVLPGSMDGFALSQTVRNRAPDIKILLTSGFSDHDAAPPNLNSADILRKPYKRQDLLRRLQAL